MNSIKLKHLLESLDEAHQQGEWWIDNMGEVKPYKKDGYYADDNLMQDDKWKRMKASKEKIEIFTHDFGAEDLRLIIKGIEKIMGVENTADDPDAVVGKDGYTGPRVDIHLGKKKKSFHNVPMGILKKSLPSQAKQYEDGKQPDPATPVNEDYHHLHKDYRLFEANDNIVAMFEDNSRLRFEVHYHNKHGEDREKWRRRAFSKWKSLANEIHRDIQLTEVGNPIEKSWKQAFEEALERPELQEFIRKPEHQSVFNVK